MKKTILAFILILLCALCACEDAKPVETTAVTTTAPMETTSPIETTAITTTAPILSTEPQTIAKQAGILQNLSWVYNLAYDVSYDYDGLQATFSLTLPVGWKQSGNMYGSADNTQYMRLSDIYESSQAGLRKLPIMRYLGEQGEQIDTTLQDGLVIYVHENNGPDAEQHSYFMQGYARIQDSYYFNFYFYTDTADTTQLISILQTAAFVKFPETAPQEDVQVQIHEPLRTVRIDDLRYISCVYDEPSAMPDGSYLEIGIPASWQCIEKTDKANRPHSVIFAENGMPGVGLSPEQCRYQAFCGDELYVKETASFGGEEGTTADGKKYWMTSHENGDYHAVEYFVTVQISDMHYYSFLLCADKDNGDLIYKVLDSIKLCEKDADIALPSEQTKAIEHMASLFSAFTPDSLPIDKENEDSLGVTVALPKVITEEEWNAIGLGGTLYEIDSDSRLTVERVQYEFARHTGDVSEIGSDTTASGKEYILTKHQYRDESIYYAAYLRITPNYIWRVTADVEVLDERMKGMLIEMLESAVLTGAVDSIPAVETAKNFVPVVLDIEYYKNLSTLGNLAADDGALTGKIELLLPASWGETNIQVGRDAYMGAIPPATAFVADSDALAASPLPGYIASEGLYCIDIPDKFPFDTALLNRLTFRRDFYPEETVTEGTAAQGYPYLLRREDIGDYATAHYMALVQVSDSYIYSFDLYCDLTDETMIYTILDSLRYTAE